jgi:hypothetical protein
MGYPGVTHDRYYRIGSARFHFDDISVPADCSATVRGHPGDRHKSLLHKALHSFLVIAGPLMASALR